MLEVVVLGEKGFLSLGVGLARDQLGFLVDIAEAVQQGGHAAVGVADLEGVFNPLGNSLGREIDMRLQMRNEIGQLRIAELTVTATVGDVDERFKPNLLMATEVIAHGIGIDCSTSAAAPALQLVASSPTALM